MHSRTSFRYTITKSEVYTRIILTAVWFAAGALTFFGVMKCKISWNMGWGDFFAGMGIVFLLMATSVMIYKPIRDVV